MTMFADRAFARVLTWLFGVAALSLLTACASAGSGPPAPASEGVDIGYGEVDEDHLVGSVHTVRADDERTQRSRTLIDMLSRLPGVRVIERPDGMIVRVRGASSFMSDEEPLFVIDGMAIQSSAGLAGINPFTIESITVLKDAGETAVYGSRGANGVILIKTKGGSR